MTLEDLLSEISSRGWYVYTCGENPPSPSHMHWECSLRCANPPLIAHGYGATLAEALSRAIDGMDSAEVYALREVKVFTGYLGNEPAKADLSGIISKLTAKPKINRRV